MPFRISWGPGAGAVTVIVATADAALALAADYELQGRTDIAVTTLEGAELSMIELKALVAVGPNEGAAVPH